MNTIREPARDIPVINDVDIVVLGGSCTGVFAAVRAARLGAKVAIVEQADRLFCNLFSKNTIDKYTKIDYNINVGVSQP